MEGLEYNQSRAVVAVLVESSNMSPVRKKSLDTGVSSAGTLGRVEFGAGENRKRPARVLEFAAGGQYLTV